MTAFLRASLPAFLALFLAFPAQAAPAAKPPADPRMQERVLGNAKAPVTVDEFISLTCSHCAEFYTKTLPALKKDYIDTGKVKFVLHDFPLDGVALKAAALARCMPKDEYFPFIDVLYKNQLTWAFGGNADSYLIQYASLGGLAPDDAKKCLADVKLQDAVAGEREAATAKYNIDATPTFIVNGTQTIAGAQPEAAFAAAFDKLLKKKK